MFQIPKFTDTLSWGSLLIAGTVFLTGISTAIITLNKAIKAFKELMEPFHRFGQEHDALMGDYCERKNITRRSIWQK